MTNSRRRLPTALSSAVPGYYRLPRPLDLDALNGLPCTLYHVDATGVVTRDELLTAIASALSIPAPIPNWDALLDTLRDLFWLPGDDRSAITVTGLAALAQAEPAAARTLERVMLDAATFWAKHPARAPLFVLELPGREGHPVPPADP